MKVIYRRPFLKSFQGRNKSEQDIIHKTIEEILKYLKTEQAAYGLRIRRLHKRIYEARINIHLRIAYFREKDVIKFFCLGNHDDIKQCLKSLKQLLK